MPFLVPLAISAGGAIAGAVAGNKLSKSKPTATEQQVNPLIQEAQRSGLDLSKSLSGQGASFLSQSQQTAAQPLNYWASILSGNRGQLMSVLAPEIFRIGEGYQAANRTSAALNPRGGATASFNAELPYAQQRDVSTLMQQARPAAAQSLFAGSQQLAGTGSSLFGNAVNALYSSTAAGRDLLANEAERKRLEAERGRSIGGGIFDLLSRYGPDIAGLLRGSGGGDWSGSGNPKYG